MTKEQKKRIKDFKCMQKLFDCDNCPVNIDPYHSYYGCISLALKSNDKHVLQSIKEYNIDMRKVR